jgi:hypothetical protein
VTRTRGFDLRTDCEGELFLSEYTTRRDTLMRSDSITACV